MYLLFLLLWIIFNGSLTLEIFLFGVVIAAALLWFVCRFADHSLEKELEIYKKSFLFVRYAAFLVKEIIKANFGVIRLILTQKEEIDPMLVEFHTDLKTSEGKAFLANAITLTPGTITVSLEEDKVTVHCLDESMSEGMNDSEFITYIRKLESGSQDRQASKTSQKQNKQTANAHGEQGKQEPKGSEKQTTQASVKAGKKKSNKKGKGKR